MGKGTQGQRRAYGYMVHVGLLDRWNLPEKRFLKDLLIVGGQVWDKHQTEAFDLRRWKTVYNKCQLEILEDKFEEIWEPVGTDTLYNEMFPDVLQNELFDAALGGYETKLKSPLQCYITYDK